MKLSIMFSLSLLVALLSLAGCQSTPIKDETAVTAPPTIPVTEEASLDTTLENRVLNLENQMKAAQPTLKKVEAMETHFKALSFELDKIEETYNMVDTNASTMKSVPMATESVKPEPKKSISDLSEKPVEIKKSIPVSSEFSVTSVRIGEQGKNITRIVLDTTNSAEINYDLDNVEGLLVIEIPKAKWSTTKSQVFQKSPMIKSFQASADEKGSRFVADLKQKAKVVATARLKPSGASGHRVYIDITPIKN